MEIHIKHPGSHFEPPPRPDPVKVDGVVSRFGPRLSGTGPRGFSLMLAGSSTIYSFEGHTPVYHAGSWQSEPHSTLVELTSLGDHVTFVLKDGGSSKAKPGTLRNWTLEHVLAGNPEKVIPGESQPALPGKADLLPE